MTLIKKTISSLVLTAVLILSCKQVLPPDPQAGFQRKRIRTLLKNTEISDSGYYVFYWDGKDDSSQYVQPGLYRAVLNNSNKLEYFFNALDGGEPGKNNEARFELKEVSITEILDVTPNPFQVQSGTNIGINYYGNGTLTLEIFFDKEPD